MPPKDHFKAMIYSALVKNIETIQERAYFAISASTVTSEVKSAWLNCSTILCETEKRNYVVNTTFCSSNHQQIRVPVLKLGSSTELVLLTSSNDNRFEVRCAIVIQLADMYHGLITFGPLTSANENIVIFPTCLRSPTYITSSMVLNKTANVTIDRKECLIQYASVHPHKTPFLTGRIYPVFQELPSGKVSVWSGYVTSPNFIGIPCNFDVLCDQGFLISVPEDRIVVVKFSHFQIAPDNLRSYFDKWSQRNCKDFVRILFVETDSINGLVLWEGCGFRNPMMQTYFHSIMIQFRSFDPRLTELNTFRLTYTIVPRSQELVLTADNMYNCTVSYFYKYKDLLGCNLVKECDDNEDENGCTIYSTACGVGAVESGEKCYTLVYPHRYLSWFEAQSVCLSKQQSLVTFTPYDKDATEILKLMGSEYNVYEFFVGVHMGLGSLTTPLSTLYRTFWRRTDGRMAFIQIHFQSETYLHIHSRFPKCGVFWIRFFTSADPDEPVAVECKRPLNVQILCEFTNPRKKGLSRPTLGNLLLNGSYHRNQSRQLVSCPGKHVTRDFLFCDAESHCGMKEMLMYCRLSSYKASMFTCEDGTQTLHYSLVCDHVEQCPDDSDEAFCVHKPCSADMFSCNNHQCFGKAVQCNGRLDCFDKSDESCSIGLAKKSRKLPPPPAIIDLSGNGTFHVKASYDCPPTHFKCLDNYCLPVYLRCNGIADCTKHEDEVACDSYTCQGYYRCRSSAVCLHPDHICDQTVHCPQYDDELVCHSITCPEVCECQGLVFVCTANFQVSSYPHLRYLDVTGVHEWSQSLERNLYLISVSLSDTGLISVPLLSLQNLQHLDLSRNAITSISLQTFSFLRNLKVISLSGNPVWMVSNTKLSNSDVDMLKKNSLSYGGDEQKRDCANLQTIDLASTNVKGFDSNVYASCRQLKLLNMSWSRLHTISDEGFTFFQKLEVVDFRGTALKSFPHTLLKNLTVLHSVYSDNPLLCCETMLPSGFDIGYCFTKPDPVSSCHYLFRSNIVRVLLLILSILSIVGNIGTTLWKLSMSNSEVGGLDIFIHNLFIADLCESFYMVIVVAADRVYRGEYLWQADKWKNSVACNLAGVLSLSFTEVSAFSICFITLDCFLVLRFPFNQPHFSRRSAFLACGSVWFVGVLLAVVPLLPVTSHWQFYQQTGICMPLPFSHGEGFEGHSYSQRVLTVVNFVLFMLIAMGQAVIYWSSHGNSVSSRHTVSRDMVSAVRLSTVVMSNLLCRLPVGLLGLLTSAGTSVSDTINVGTAILVLPLNATLNPVLYVLSVVSERRGRQQRERLIEQLKAKLRQDARKPVTESAASKSTVLAQIKTCIKARVLTREDVSQHLIQGDTQPASKQ